MGSSFYSLLQTTTRKHPESPISQKKNQTNNFQNEEEFVNAVTRVLRLETCCVFLRWHFQVFLNFVSLNELSHLAL